MFRFFKATCNYRDDMNRSYDLNQKKKKRILQADFIIAQLVRKLRQVILLTRSLLTILLTIRYFSIHILSIRHQKINIVRTYKNQSIRKNNSFFSKLKLNKFQG
jgi:hypothetical protein